jgi:hypothetical protein
MPNLRIPFYFVLAFLCLAIVFALAYAQAPLYTSNQNQYFLHGMAQAGVGDLRTDWLAGTVDPTPIFSALVRLTIGVFHSDWLFYVEYGLLLGVYAGSWLAILATMFPLGRDARRWSVAVAALVLLHSAAMRYGLSQIGGADWSYLLEDGLAGQRALGSVFQPSVFAVFLLLSVALFLHEKRWQGVLAAAFAATVHPTYLLGAAILTTAYMFTQWREDHALRRPVILGVFALATVAPILVYAYGSFLNSDFSIAHHARVLLVNDRIPHHALVSVWFGWPDAWKVMVIAAAIWVSRRSKLSPILWISTGAAAALTIAQILSGSVLLALIFPWRISVFVFPLAILVLLAAALSALWSRLDARVLRTLSIMAGVSVMMVVGIGIVRFTLDLQKKASQPERALMNFVAAHPQPGAIYMIPLKMQDFRLATGAAVYVDKESIPYRDLDVLEWNRRLVLAHGFFDKLSCSAVEKFQQREGITHLVVETDNNPQVRVCPNLLRLYGDEEYVLYEIR